MTDETSWPETQGVLEISDNRDYQTEKKRFESFVNRLDLPNKVTLYISHMGKGPLRFRVPSEDERRLHFAALEVHPPVGGRIHSVITGDFYGELADKIKNREEIDLDEQRVPRFSTDMLRMQPGFKHLRFNLYESFNGEKPEYDSIAFSLDRGRITPMRFINVYF